MRFRPPASVELRRAQMLLLLAAVVPTSLATAVGIIWLAVARRSAEVLMGVLVLAFCALAITGAILVQIFLRRGDSLARLQNDFVSAVSHELRTPLTSIRLFVETLAMGRVQGDPEETRRCLAMLAQEVTRLERLVERILELARLEAGKREFVRRPTPVAEVVDGAVAAFEAVRLAGGGPSVQIGRRLEPGLVIDVDRQAFEQALVNLLVNAWKYTGEEKRIEVHAASRGPRKIEISVTDNGPGISRADRKIIFDRFERGADATRTDAQGVGMGLAVVNMIVRAHRGKVEVDSEPGRGACFRLLLPRSATS